MGSWAQTFAAQSSSHSALVVEVLWRRSKCWEANGTCYLLFVLSPMPLPICDQDSSTWDTESLKHIVRSKLWLLMALPKCCSFRNLSPIVIKGQGGQCLVPTIAKTWNIKRWIVKRHKHSWGDWRGFACRWWSRLWATQGDIDDREPCLDNSQIHRSYLEQEEHDRSQERRMSACCFCFRSSWMSFAG